MNDFGHYLLKNLYWFLIFSAGIVLHSIEQVHCNGVETWLPWWLLTDKNWFGLPEIGFWTAWDGFHFVKGASLVLIGYSVGLGLFATLMMTQRVLFVIGTEILKWLIAWQIFNIFYHIIWRPIV